MEKLYKTCIIILSICYVVTGKAQTQSITTLWGTSYAGGIGSGNIFSYVANTTTNRHAFQNSEYPYGALTLSKDKTAFWGMTSAGGKDNLGTIFRYDLNTRVLSTLYSFVGQAKGDGATPYGAILEGSDGGLYGMTSAGGTFNKGVVFRYEKGNFKILHEFGDTKDNDGASPYGSLIEIDGMLLGMTSAGGDMAVEAAGAGTIFSIRIDGSSYKVYPFPGKGNLGKQPYGSLTVGASNNILYGMTRLGETSAGPMGILFEFDLAKFTVSRVLHGFVGGTADGGNPYGDVLYIQENNTLVGLTYNGGAENVGTIFSYGLAKNSYALRHSFSSKSGGTYPLGSLMRPSSDNTYFYGTTATGGSGDPKSGTLFKWNPTNGIFTLSDFDSKNARLPYFSKLVEYIPAACDPAGAPAAPTIVNTCVGSTPTPLTATANNGYRLLWYGTDPLNNPSLVASVPPTSVAGTSTYYVSQILNGCESPKTAIRVNVNNLPESPGVSPVSYCQGAPTVALTAVQTAKIGLLWYGTNATGGTASTVAPTPSSAVAGTTNYYVSQMESNGCESPRASIAVTINALPAAPGTAPIGYCLNAAAQPLTAVASSYSIQTAVIRFSLNWYGTNASGGTASSTAPTPQTAKESITSYYVSQTNPLTRCEGPRGVIVVSVNPLPVPPKVVTPLLGCLNATAPVLSASGTSLLWYVSSTATGTPTPPALSTAKPGTFTYLVSQTDANGCESAKANITYTVNNRPNNPLLSIINDSLCQYEKSPNLANIVYDVTSPGTLYWYKELTQGTTNPSVVVPVVDSSIVGSTTYYVYRLYNGCTSDVVKFTVVVTPIPKVPISPTLPVLCEGDKFTLNAPGTPTGKYYWYETLTGGAPRNNPYNTSASFVNPAYYLIDSTRLGCKSARVEVKIPVTKRLVPSVSISVPSTTICTGSTVTFTATPQNGGTAPNYQWFKNGIALGAAASANTLTLSNLLDKDFVSVVMNSSATCLTTSSAASNTITMVVTTSTIPAAKITTPSTSVCAGTEVAFEASIANGGTAPAYQWRINSKNIASATTSIFKSTTLTDKDTVSLQLTSNSTCVSTAIAISNKIVMNLMANQTPSVSVTAVSGTTICTGAMASFKATAVNGGNFPTYQWLVNNVVMSDDTSSSYISRTLVQGDKISVKLNSKLMCLASNAATSNVLTMTVSTVVPSVTVSTSTPIICQGATAVFTATPVNGGTGAMYQWRLNGNDLNKPVTSNTFSSAALLEGDVVSVVLLSKATCASPTTAVSNNITMKVNPILTPSVSISASVTQRVVCEGTSVSFTATATSAGTTPTYQWKVNNVNSGTNSATFTTTTLKNKDTVSLVLNTTATCVSSNVAISNKIGMNINANLLPSVSITGSATVVCSDSSVYFTASPVNGGSAPEYQWSVNGANVGTASSSDIFSSKTLANNSIVSVVMKSSATCVTSASVTSVNSITVAVKPNVSPTVAIVSPSLICSGSSATFTANQLNAGSNATYQWKINNINIGNAGTSNVFTSNSLTNTDKVAVVLRSKEMCLLVDSALATTNSLVVNMAPNITSQPSATSACEGSMANFFVSAQGTGLTYQWLLNGSNITGATNPGFSISNVTKAQNNNIYSVVVKGTCGAPLTSNAVQLTVLEKPSILVQPVSSATCALGSVHFIVVAKGSNLNYQWMRNNVPVENGPSYVGANNDTLTVNGVNLDQNGSSFAVYINACSTQVFSNPAILTVGTNFVTSVNVTASDTVVCKGTSVAFMASSSNGGNTPLYQWLRNGSPIVGAKSASYVADILQNNDQIACEMTSSNTCVSVKTVVSKAISIDVNDSPPSITQVVQDSICGQGAALLKATASDGIVIWYNTVSGGLALDTGTVFESPVLNTASTYYASAFYKGCTSESRTPVSISYSTQPVVFAGADQKVCESAGAILLVGTSNTGHITWSSTSVAQPIALDSLKAQYVIQPSDVLSGKVIFIASSAQNGVCKAVSDTVLYKIAGAGTSAAYIAPSDSMVVAHIIISNFPLGQTAYKADDPSTWKGVKTACGYVTEIRWPSKNLKGTLREIENLTQLEALDLSHNELDSVQTNLSFVSSRLKVLNLSHNKIKYQRALSWQDYTFLDTVDLSHNSFGNSVSFGNKAPVYIDLSHNRFLSFKATRNDPLKVLPTVYLNLSNNQISNSGIAQLDSLDQLSHLDLSYNSLLDGIPVRTSLPALKYYNASHNSLTGGLPNLDVWQLDTLIMSHNHLSGDITALEQQVSLKVLDLGNNRFQGDLGADFRGLQSLIYFAVDSNRAGTDESAAGITSLPSLPLTTGLQLSVQDNHLDFEDLEPYALLLNKASTTYAPQFPDVDVSYTTKPAEGSFINLSTSLGGINTTYQWVKLDKATQLYKDLSIPTAQEQIFKKQFVNADTGSYATIINNTDFPGLSFYRRPILVEACEFSYNTNFFVKKPTLDKCFGIDTLFIEFTTKDHKPVTAYSNIWFFNDLNIQSEAQKSIPIHVSGIYTFLAYDSTSGCSIFSKDTIMVKTTTKINPALEIAFDVADSSLSITSTLSEFQESNLQWMVDGYPIADATDKKLRIYFNAVYELISVKKDNCSAVSKPLKVSAFNKDFLRQDHSIDARGQIYLNLWEGLQVYPSPTQGMFNIVGLSVGEEVSISNAQGLEVCKGVAGSSSFTVDGADLPAGVYLIKVSQNDAHRCSKVVIIP